MMTLVGHRLLRSVGAIAACVALSSGEARANGRFPTAQFFSLGEGPAARDRVAISTTFGLLVSLDGGARWSWVCEDALGFSGEYDPATGITESGALVVTLPSGASIARGDWCDFAPIREAGADATTDVTVLGTRVALAQQLATGGTQLLLSDDDGATFRRAWSSASYFVQTIDFAPSNPLLLYATAQDRGSYPWVLRSDSGGDVFDPSTAAPIARTLATFLAAVDARDDGRLLLRGFASDGTSVLWRSDDAGATLRTLLTREGALVGAAASAGFESIWAMSTEEGARLLRSDDGGARFRAMATTLRARSLRYRRGVVFATASEQQAGYSFACSQDGGESFRPMLSVEDIRGPDVCPEGSVVRTRCAPLWPALRSQLLAIARPAAPPRSTCAEGVWAPPGADASADGALEDAASTDATQDDATQIDAVSDAPSPQDASAARDASALDVDDGRADAAGAPSLRAGGGCQCAARGSRSRDSARSVSALVLAWALVRARRSPRHLRRR